VYGNEIEADAGNSDSAGGEKAEGLVSIGEVMKRRRDQERIMRKTFLLLAVSLVLGTSVASAKDKDMQGTIVSENSVPCGSEAKSKKQSVQMMCQEYVIRTDATDYHVRQEKEEHKALLPVNAPVELTLSKDKMKFKVNGKGYEMLVVSESAAPAGAPVAAPVAPAAAPKR
jgi:hypothetical protein